MRRRFVYGDFGVANGKSKRVAQRTFGSGAAFAIEIVHEPSANQLVGKLHRRISSVQWLPVSAGKLETYPWYQQFQEQGQLQFDMEGSGSWDVLHFRLESDDTGPYVAVALQYAQQQVAVGQ